MQSFKNELKQVLRRLGRAPLFTVITLVTLAAGVGANTVVFSVLEGVLLKPLPYPKPDELIGVWLTAPGIQLKEFELSPSDYFIFREQNRTLQDLGLYAGDSVSVTGIAEPEQVRALRVTDGTLPLLGIPPLLGRSFTKQDDSPGAPKPSCSPTAIGVANLVAIPQSLAATSSWMARAVKSSVPYLSDFISWIGKIPP